MLFRKKEEKRVVELNAKEVRLLRTAPNAHNPNHSRQVIPVGEGFGFVVYFNYPNFNKKK